MVEILEILGAANSSPSFPPVRPSGRAVDQILPHHCSPELYEGYVRDARTYLQVCAQSWLCVSFCCRSGVGPGSPIAAPRHPPFPHPAPALPQLAEAANGPLPPERGFAYPWGFALQVMQVCNCLLGSNCRVAAGGPCQLHGELLPGPDSSAQLGNPMRGRRAWRLASAGDGARRSGDQPGNGGDHAPRALAPQGNQLSHAPWECAHNNRRRHRRVHAREWAWAGGRVGGRRACPALPFVKAPPHPTTEASRQAPKYPTAVHSHRACGPMPSHTTSSRLHHFFLLSSMQANNHVADWGFQGLEETLGALHAAGAGQQRGWGRCARAGTSARFPLLPAALRRSRAGAATAGSPPNHISRRPNLQACRPRGRGATWARQKRPRWCPS